LLLVSCGFHLRGAGGGTMLPAALAAVRVVSSSPLANEPFTVAVRDALTQAGAKIVDAPEAPAVVLLGEQTETRVASVSTATARASGYLLLYSTSFKLDGPQPIATQTVRLQRSYTFDPTQVLAREQQEQELLRDMRRDAAQQIVRRLARTSASQDKQ
jgi:LPS-assembly lipoprotein